VSVQIVEEVSTVEDAVALGLAADEFLLVPLKAFCASEIKRLVTVETVWNTLNSIVRIPDLPDACTEVKTFIFLTGCYFFKAFDKQSSVSLF